MNAQWVVQDMPVNRPVAQRSTAAPPRLPADGMEELLMLVLDQIDHGIALVSPQGDVALANQAFRRGCAASQVLSIDGWRLQLASGDRGALTRALAQATTGRRSLLALDDAGRRLWLATVPMGRGASGAGSDLVLVLMGRRALCERVSLALFAGHHRLTAAESAVLRQLSDGARPEDIANETSVAISTVRTQICSIRQKTGAGSIDQLMRLLSGLPPLQSLAGLG